MNRTARGERGRLMQFVVARPDAVRAINQRWLLKFWTQNLNGARMPQWQSVAADSIATLSANLSFLDVTGDEPPRFLIRFHGATIAKAYGSSDCRGKYLDEVIPVARHGEGLSPYWKVVESGAPVYTIHDVTDGDGRLIHYERLLLPFGREGETVDRILAAFEFICADGGFDSQALMTTQPPTLRLSATIEAPVAA